MSEEEMRETMLHYLLNPEDLVYLNTLGSEFAETVDIDQPLEDPEMLPVDTEANSERTEPSHTNTEDPLRACYHQSR
jgi:hypothetical protein